MIIFTKLFYILELDKNLSGVCRFEISFKNSYCFTMKVKLKLQQLKCLEITLIFFMDLDEDHDFITTIDN